MPIEVFLPGDTILLSPGNLPLKIRVELMTMAAISTIHDVTREHRLEGLRHPEFEVRSELLLQYSYESCPDALATAYVIAEIEARGWDEAYEYSHLVASLTHTEDSVAWVAERLRNPRPQKNPNHLPESAHLARWLGKAPPQWVAPHLASIIDLDAARSDPVYFEDGSRDGLQDVFLKTEYAGRSEEELFALLEKNWQDCAACEEFPHQAVKEMEVICSALSRAEHPSPSTCEEWLATDCSADREIDWTDYRTGSAMMLIRSRREAPPTEALIRLFDMDWDWWDELIKDTLMESGSEDTLVEVIQRYPSLDWHAKLFLTSVFESLRFPGREAEIIALAKGEEDDELRVMLAHAAATYGTYDSRRFAAAVASEYPEDPERGAIVNLLRCYEILLGENDEKTREWLKSRVRQRKEGEKRMAHFNKLLSRSPPLEDAHTAGLEISTRVAKERVEKVPPGRTASPNPHPGVGRNDACPCGSGKKYKKCCLK